VIKSVALITWLAPLLGALMAGLLGEKLGPKNTHRFTIGMVTISLLGALYLSSIFIIHSSDPIFAKLFTWIDSNTFIIEIGIYLDALSVIMMLVVAFVSLLVHIYSIGYMAGDEGYCRFFSYVSLFTFAMFALVGAQNFAQLFFGWEGVGVVSYLLIGYYFTKPSAVNGGLKAFLVNRIGDLGLLIAIALIFYYVGALDYPTVIPMLEKFDQDILYLGLFEINGLTLIAFTLLVGAMGKSAQIPLHVWLPESMEGPTPISALIHAATMVTAGVFLICRMSPIFDYSPAVLNLILIIGSTGALFLGLVGIVQNDIKRIVAYSTLSQLGYMIAATGASAYTAAMFHLLMHAFFKALLFLCAGSVIVAMHHEQNIQNMGGLRRELPITFVCSLIGTLSLVAFPFTSGFYSKDSIISAVHHCYLPAASYAYMCLLLGAGATSIYSFRSLFLTFFGKKRFTGAVSEPKWQITFPLIVLAIPSLFLGMSSVGLFFIGNIFGNTLSTSTIANAQMKLLSHEFANPLLSGIDALFHPAFYFMILGFVITLFCYITNHETFNRIKPSLKRIAYPLEMKFGFDWFNDHIIVRSIIQFSRRLYRYLDKHVIDEGIILGLAKRCLQASYTFKIVQTGYVYHYASMTILSLFLIIFFVLYIGI
tara:strand:- start:6768 stop:8717 length:1950 start_codon:yes stop_codon:yes gene_type:complete